MKFLENFGGFVLENKWVFPTLVALCIAVIVYNQPQSVILNAKHWECGGAVPDGISAKCTSYIYRGK
jgi:hypothetical protein